MAHMDPSWELLIIIKSLLIINIIELSLMLCYMLFIIYNICYMFSSP